jgi:uncharacterized protein YjbI with pentapeptide repeats
MDPEPGRDGSATATAAVATCQWRLRRFGLDDACTQPVDSAHPSRCILHDPNTNKDIGRFDQAQREKIQREEADPDVAAVDMAGVVFPGEADFSNRVFQKGVNFYEAEFGGAVSFGGARFGGAVGFAGAHFGGEAQFGRTHFGGKVDFGGAHFEGVARFWGAHFGGVADFESAHFGGVAQFGEELLFGGVYFEGEARFGDAHFEGEARFGDAHFEGEANFWGAHFGGEAYFGGAEFARAAVFSRAIVERSLSFRRKTFQPDAAGKSVDFADLTPESARRVRFEDVDLSRASFLRTDVSQVHFVGCTWAHKSQPLLWPLPVPRPRQERLVIYEELLLDQEKEKRADFPLVAERYRQLRLNLEASRQEAEAGHFYVGQMEMRRQDPAYSRPYRWLLAAYRVLALYGESYLRPPFFYFVFGVAFALAYLWGGFQVGQAQVRYNSGTFDWGQAGHFFKDSVRAYVQALTAGGLLGANPFGGQLGASLETTSWWVPAVRYLNMVLDTFLLGFFVIALRRHFHR